MGEFRPSIAKADEIGVMLPLVDHFSKYPGFKARLLRGAVV